jgi:acyl-coenzyme A thioesterase PaaI-like protein
MELSYAERTPVITESTDETLESLRKKHHSGCVACGAEDPLGLRLKMSRIEDSNVEGSFYLPMNLQSYDGQLHGGAIALILDCAMTNCLFSHGVADLTTDMRVRYSRPLPVGGHAAFRAEITQEFDPLFHLRSEISFDGFVVASAVGKFVRQETATSMRTIFG